MKLNNKGFSVIEFIVAVLVLSAIGGLSWRIYDNIQKKEEPKPAAAITNFDECVAAGNPVMESYPEQCAANGQTFVNESQKSQTDPKDDVEYLEIPEFGVKLQLTAELSDTYYIKSDGEKVLFSREKFKGTECAAEKAAQVGLTKTTKEEAQSNPFIGGEGRMDELIKVGDYYYFIIRAGLAQCSMDEKLHSEAIEFRDNLKAAIRDNLEPLEN